jgi:hypothetical protein
MSINEAEHALLYLLGNFISFVGAVHSHGSLPRKGGNQEEEKGTQAKILIIDIGRYIW